MARLNTVTMLISVVAISVAVYTLASINQSQRGVIPAKEGDGTPARSRTSQIQAAGAGVAVLQNRLGGAGAIELRRGNRLDLFGVDDTFGQVRNPFDLSSLDEDAANKLTATLVGPATVTPFNPFPMSWEVTGPGSALSRVISYQLNVFSFGPIVGLSAETNLTSDGLMARGVVFTSMWRSGSVSLWARFGSGFRELEVTDVTVDLSACSDERLGLAGPTLLFQTLGGPGIVQAIHEEAEEAEEDVTVTVLNDAVADFWSDGFTFDMKLKLEAQGATLIVDLGMKFMAVPKAGHLATGFSGPGYRSVIIDADLPWIDDLGHAITLSEHDLSLYKIRFSDGLKLLADRFSSDIGRQVRGLPDPDDLDYDVLEAEAPKAVASAIDISSEELVVTLCPMRGSWVVVGGIFPADIVNALTTPDLGEQRK